MVESKKQFLIKNLPAIGGLVVMPIAVAMSSLGFLEPEMPPPGY